MNTETTPSFKIAGASIAVVRDTNGETVTFVVFRPAKMLVDQVIATIEDGTRFSITLSDANGEFTNGETVIFEDAVFEPGTNSAMITAARI